MGETTGRVIVTISIWVAVGVLSWLFNSFGILTGEGAGLMAFVAFLFTAGLWRGLD